MRSSLGQGTTKIHRTRTIFPVRCTWHVTGAEKERERERVVFSLVPILAFARVRTFQASWTRQACARASGHRVSRANAPAASLTIEAGPFAWNTCPLDEDLDGNTIVIYIRASTRPNATKRDSKHFGGLSLLETSKLYLTSFSFSFFFKLPPRFRARKSRVYNFWHWNVP